MKKNKVSNATTMEKSESIQGQAINSQDFSSSGIFNTDGEDTALQMKKQASKPEVSKNKTALVGKKASLKPGKSQDDILCNNLDHFDNYDELKNLIKEYAKTDVQKRTYTHIQSMQQNIDILKLMYEKIETFCKNNEKSEEFPKNIKEIINATDKYGNTPLLLSCVYDEDDKSGSKIECVKYLLYLGADPNIQNKETGFTALHWASRYGEIEVVDLLINNKKQPAIEYIPDFNGYMPVDYAGMFKNFAVVKRLIELTHSRITDTNPQGNSDINPDSSLIPNLKLIIQNPMLQSTLLYWASAIPEGSEGISSEQLKSMFLGGSLQTFPEINLYVANGKTALHAAAQSGNQYKLAALIEDVKSRQVEQSSKSIAMKSKKERKSNKSFEALMNCKNMKQYSKNLDKFYKRMDELSGQKSVSWINTQCEDGLTPLHLTCQLNHRECTEILLIENGASLDEASDSGLRPRDLIQHVDIKQAFQEYFKRIDRAIKGVQQTDLKQLKKSGTLRLKDKEGGLARQTTLQSNISKQKEESQAHQNEIDELCMQSLLQTYREKGPQDWNIIHRALKDREWLPEISYMALKLKIPNYQNRRINNLISAFVKYKFIVRMFPAIVPIGEQEDVYYLILELSQEDLENYAEELKYPMKYVNENLKSPYDINFKSKFEPFRSKDIQTIMEMIIDETIQRDELDQLLIQKFPMHNLYEINTIEAKHSETSLYEFFSQNSFIPTLERKEEFNAVNALKNYFGERHGFLYAFKNYYTAWLTVPALLGILLSFDLLVYGNYISLYSYAFAIFMSLWITMFIEFWKRKQNQFRQVWGTLVDKNSFNKKIRTEFVSNEEFSHINFEVVNVDTHPYWGVFFKFLSRIFMSILITITVTVFLTLKQYDLGIYAGVINGLVSNITSYAFTYTVVWFNNKENHKHEDSFINSLIQKVFYFKFINTNITIIWTIYQTTDTEQAEGQFQKLYTYIFGFILQKLTMLFVWRVLVKYMKFLKNKRQYFNLCNKKAEEQMETHRRNMSNFKKKAHKLDQVTKIEEMEAKRREFEIFKHLQDPKELEYKRLITVFDQDKERALRRSHISTYTCMQTDQMLIDQVELNSRMDNVTMPMEIFDLSEDFILCAFATLYSFICPTIALLIFVSRMLMARFERKAHLNLRVRQPVLHQNGLGFWLTILETIGYFTVILNVWFLYLFKNQFADFIRIKFQSLLDIIFESVIEDRILKETPVDDPTNTITDDLSFYDDGVDTEKVLQEASTETLKQLVRAALAIIQRQDSISQFIFIIVAGEHLIILIKVFIDAFIGDISQKVQNKQIRIESMLEEIDDQLKSKQSDNEIKVLNEKFQKQRKTFKRIIDVANERYQDLAEKANIYHEESLKQIRQEQQIFSGEIEQVDIGRRSTLQNQSGKKKSALSQMDSVKSRRSSQASIMIESDHMSQSPSLNKGSIKGSLRESNNQSPLMNKSALMIPGGSPMKLTPMKTLPKFIKTKPSLTGFLEEALQNMNLEYGLEQKLNTQMHIRLFRETFLMIERNLLQKRLVQVGTLSERVILNCSECMESRAIIQCWGCQGDLFCQKCFSEVHQAQSNHDFSKIGKGHLEQNISTLNEGKRDPKKIKQWQKFEQFNFPSQIYNEGYGQLKLYFTMIKNIYVHMNNINDDTMKLDIVKYLIDQNYSILGEQNKRMFLSKFKNEQKSTIIGINDLEIETQAADPNDLPDKMGSVKRLKQIQKAESSFNSEELLFLNRVVFYLLSNFGANLQFSKFIETLKVIQDGKFIEKVDLAIQFLKYGRNTQKFIRTDDFVNFFMSSMPQDIFQNFDAPKELRKTFDEGQMFISCEHLKEKIIYSKGSARDILQCVLQS